MAHPILSKTGFSSLAYWWCRLLHRKLRSARGTVLVAFVVLVVFTISRVWSAYRGQRFGKFTQFTSTRPKDKDRCIHPELDAYHPTMMELYEKVDPVNCSSAMTNWVYVSNGIFHISADAIRQHGNITCEYAPLVRTGDFSVASGNVIIPMLSGTPVTADFFSVLCESSDGKVYSNAHSAVARDATVRKRLHDYHTEADRKRTVTQAESPSSAHSLSKHKLSVLIFGFDSLSHMAWLRLLPKTRSYFVQTLRGIELEGYNVVGEGTAAALLPILTGFTEEELPEARKGFAGAKEVDGYPWIWRNFSKQGYVTTFAEDTRNMGAFQHSMLGFKDQPTDHYMRPFSLMETAQYTKNRLCIGSTPRHVNFMNWFRDLFATYKGFPKFFFGFQTQPSFKSNNQVQAVDDDLVAFLQALEEEGYLNSTVLILMSDHGAQYASVRSTAQGRLEERMPYFSLRFPPWFYRLYPKITDNLLTNIDRLTTPFDIHATLQDLLNYSPSSDEVDKGSRSISLFREIPKERTCADSGVTTNWCACLAWKDVDPSDPLVLQAVEVAVRAINAFTKKRRELCEELRVQGITRSVHYVPTSRDLSAKGVPPSDPGNPSRPKVELYQVAFTTLPGQGHFEATLTLKLDTDRFKSLILGQDVTRINTYGTDPACIQKQFPHLRPFCYCKH